MTRSAMVMTVTTLLVLAFAVPAAAFQRPGHPPDSEVQARFGYLFLSGDSDLWEATDELFTLDESDFDDFVLGFSFVRSLNNYVEFGANVDFYDQIERSEFRGFVDEDGNAIFHDTELSIVPVTVDVRFIPGGRYRLRPEGRFIPKPVFYIGAGVGLTFWEYEEYGDFIEFTPEADTIFRGQFDDDGVALELHVLAGLELPVSRSASFLFEGRHSIVDDDLDTDASYLKSWEIWDYDPDGELDAREIDLGGTSLFAGFSFRF